MSKRNAVVFVHGRGYMRTTAGDYRLAWLEALNAGMSAAGRRALDDSGVHAAFYGDLFAGERHAAVSGAGSRRLRYFEQQIARAVEARLSTHAYLLQRVGGRWPDWWLELMDRVPGFSAVFLRMAFRDVYDYLTDAELRVVMMRRVFEPIAAQQDAGRVVVVAHSLGSIVTYDVLNTHPGLHADLLVTLGSPLGIERGVRRKLLADARGRRGVPSGVRRWLNVADERDIVALDPTLADDFAGRAGITDVQVSNPARSPHSATAYLRQPVVCREIASVLRS